MCSGRRPRRRRRAAQPPAAQPPAQPGCPRAGAVIVGTDGDDERAGGPLTDVIFGALGDDLLRGLAGADCLYGQGDDDRLYGARGRDRLFGGSGQDRLYGARGRDRLRGGGGGDRLFGGPGRDRIDPGAGSDRIAAGARQRPRPGARHRARQDRLRRAAAATSRSSTRSTPPATARRSEDCPRASRRGATHRYVVVVAADLAARHRQDFFAAIARWSYASDTPYYRSADAPQSRASPASASSSERRYVDSSSTPECLTGRSSPVRRSWRTSRISRGVQKARRRVGQAACGRDFGVPETREGRVRDPHGLVAGSDAPQRSVSIGAMTRPPLKPARPVRRRRPAAGSAPQAAQVGRRPEALLEGESYG